MATASITFDLPWRATFSERTPERVIVRTWDGTWVCDFDGDRAQQFADFVVEAVNNFHPKNRIGSAPRRGSEMNEHRLIGNTLVVEERGIAARCVCGWASTGHFSSMAASVAFQDHQESQSAGQSTSSMAEGGVG